MATLAGCEDFDMTFIICYYRISLYCRVCMHRLIIWIDWYALLREAKKKKNEIPINTKHIGMRIAYCMQSADIYDRGLRLNTNHNHKP